MLRNQPQRPTSLQIPRGAAHAALDHPLHFSGHDHRFGDDPDGVFVQLPAHQKLARRIGGKQGLAATLLVLGGIVLIGLPTAVLMAALGDSLQELIASARANTLTFTRQGDGVSVTAPSSPNSAPPGHYLLFILNRNGVPSIGRIIRVH